MQRKPSFIAAVALIALSVLATSCASDSPVSTATSEDASTPTSTPGSINADDAGAGLDAVLADIEARGFEGVVVIDSPDDSVVRGYGYADRQQGVSNDGETVFDIGSLTKQFTAAGILRLETEGLLSVQDRVGSILLDLESPAANATLHQLLTHTAGLTPGLGFDYDPVDWDQFVALVNAAPALPPGGEYEYSNVGYSLLARVIEQVSGQSYEAYMHDALFAPAGMVSTGYRIPNWNDQVVAVGYADEQAMGRPNEQPWADDGPYWHLRGNGGILSSATDMMRWHRALLGTTILDDNAKSKMYSRHTPEGPGADTFYGYGWALLPNPDDTVLVTHDGGNGIFFADFLRFIDQGVTVFIASNAASPRFEDIGFELAAVILDDLELEPPARCSLDSAPLDEAVEVDEFPDTPAGQVASDWFDLLENGDASARLAFATSHVGPPLVDLGSPEEIAGEIAGLQIELANADVRKLFVDDDRRFHAVLQDSSNQSLSVSIEMLADDPMLIHCISIDA